jgi:3-dehydroquinate dehydratase/shikimate dehydrogenase
MAKISIIASMTIAPSSAGRELSAIAEVADWLEVRADLTGDIDPHWIRSFFPGKLLYSLRSLSTGGTFDGSAEERASRLIEASQGYDLIELEAESDFQPPLLAKIIAGKRMLSWYGHPQDDSELMAHFERLSSIPGKLYKLVVEAESSKDALSSLYLLKSLGRSDVIAFTSGESGFWSRLVAPHFGAPMIYGSVGEGWTVDGSAPVRQLIKDYGLPRLSPVSEIYGIVGNPVTHSLSPRIHNAAYRYLKYPALFVPFQVESFSNFFQDVLSSAKLQWLGLAVKGLTVASPFKEAALLEARTSSPMCRRIGAANVFLQKDEHWEADTTDPEGVVLAIGNRGLSVKGRKAAVVGCGGSGRAIAAALAEAGAQVTLVNRGLRRGRLAAQLLGLPFMPLSSFTVDGFSILVNATPVGRNDNKKPFELPGVKDDALIIDLVYGSRPAPLIESALALGRDIIDGQEVLLIQVLRQFREMIGLDMPVDIAHEIIGWKKKRSIAIPT